MFKYNILHNNKQGDAELVVCFLKKENMIALLRLLKNASFRRYYGESGDR